VLSDGSVMINTYGCGLYRLTGVSSGSPTITNIYTFDASEPSGPGEYRGACAVPLLVDRTYWIMPVGREERLVTLDVTNPDRPREVSRLDMPKGFKPHWLARDPRSNRVLVGAHQGGQEGMFLLTLERGSGRLSFDASIRSRRGPPGYIDLAGQKWPHGNSGAAWTHAGLFLPESPEPARKKVPGRHNSLH
jgi:hypothetical protein